MPLIDGKTSISIDEAGDSLHPQNGVQEEIKKPTRNDKDKPKRFIDKFDSSEKKNEDPSPTPIDNEEIMVVIYNAINSFMNETEESLPIDFSKLPTEGLIELLKLNRDFDFYRIYDAVEMEVHRRSASQSIAPERSDSEVPADSSCCGKCSNTICKPYVDDSYDHYLEKSDIGLSCKYSSYNPMSSSIIGDILFSPENSLWYYEFVKQYYWIFFSLALILLFVAFATSTSPKLTIVIFILAECFLFTIMPCLHIAIFQDLCQKFEYLYLVCNVILFGILHTIFTIQFYGYFFCVMWFVLYVPLEASIIAIDSWPITIISRRSRLIFIGGVVAYHGILVYLYTFTNFSVYYYGEFEFFTFGRKWILNEIYAALNLNISILFGRIFWTYMTEPGYYVLVRSLVKPKMVNIRE